MPVPWDEIVDYYAEWRGRSGDPSFDEALGGVEKIAQYIANGPLASALFGWTSMSDLCIQQTAAPPYTSYYLRISPHSGTIEFRYIDTAVDERQWHRTETAETAIARLDHFLDQLHWIGGPFAPVSEGRPNV